MSRFKLPLGRWWIVGLIAGAVFLGSAAVVVATHDFSDVPSTEYYHDDVHVIKELGITLGCGGSNYCPDQNVTRGQMASFLARSAKLYRAAYYQTSTETTVTSTTYVPIASQTLSAPADCVALMNGTVDWDDNSTDGILSLQWFVDGTAVGPDFADQDEAALNQSNDSLTAIAYQILTPGDHSIELKAMVSPGDAAGIEDIGMFALCVPFDGAGNLIGG